jgi:hypothetical protein
MLFGESYEVAMCQQRDEAARRCDQLDVGVSRSLTTPFRVDVINERLRHLRAVAVIREVNACHCDREVKWYGLLLCLRLLRADYCFQEQLPAVESLVALNIGTAWRLFAQARSWFSSPCIFAAPTVLIRSTGQAYPQHRSRISMIV